VYEFGPYRLDAKRRVLLRGGEAIQLTPKVFDTLRVLVERAGGGVSKDELMREVWGEAIVEETNLTTNISLLRKALGERRDEHNYIVTIPGEGYRFVANVRTGALVPAVVIHERTRAAVTVEEEEEEREDAQDARSISSAEYLVGNVKRHKAITIFAVVALLCALGGIGFVLYRVSTRGGRAAPTPPKFTALTTGGKIGDLQIDGELSLSPD